jgi:hypothetical protein
MQLFVKLLDGRTRGFVLERTAPFRLVKEELAVSEGVRVADQRLIWAGRQIDDSATPDDAEMHSGATVHFAMRLRGGLFVETLELVWSLLKTIFGLLRDLWNYLFGRCCGGKCHCKTDDEETDSDGSSYDDVSESSSDDDDDEAKRKRKEERMKRRAARNADWGPIWAPPKDPPPLPSAPGAEDLRVHRSLFNPRDNGKWRIAPFSQNSPAILDAKPVDEARPAEQSAVVVVADAEVDEILVPEPHDELHGAYFSPAMELEAYLVEQVGIPSGTGDYAGRLIAAGISSPAQFAEIPVEALGGDPYHFRQRHVEQVQLFRSGGGGGGGSGDSDAATPGMVLP